MMSTRPRVKSFDASAGINSPSTNPLNPHLTQSMTTAITEANEAAPTVDGLFQGLAFFLTQRLPQRSHFIAQIQNNGGRVVKLEAQADYLIADHLRKDAPPGSVSYTFIEVALRHGALSDARDHPAGPPRGEVRPVGSSVRSKATRTPFTLEDDILLYAWVQEAVAKGAMAKGLDLYKQLEVKNPRHPFQAWRDRYVKKLHGNPDAPVFKGGFSRNELDSLLQQAAEIEDVAAGKQDEAWTAYSQAFPGHTPLEWSIFWRDYARPAYLADPDLRKPLSDAGSPATSSKKRKRRVEPEVNGDSGWDDPLINQSPEKKKPAVAASGMLSTGLAPAANGGSEPASSASPVRTDVRARENGSDVVTSCDPQFPAGTRQRPPTQVGGLPSDDEGSETLVEPGPIGRAPRASSNTLPLSPDEGLSHVHRNGQQEYAQPPASTSTFPTSELNRAADEQMQRESFDGDRYELGEQEERPGEENESDHVESENEPDSFIENGSPPVASQLTAANLQSLRDRHKMPALRGIDLPEDDDLQDQDQFVRYLQNVMSRDNQPPPANRAKDVPQTPDLIRSDRRNRSNERDADESGESILQFPTSQQSTLQNPTQLPSGTTALDTHSSYPILSDITAIEHCNSRTSAASTPVQSSVKYPELPRHQDNEDETGMSSVKSSQPLAQRDDRWPRYKPSDVEGGDRLATEDDVELDLIVPEPEGGFGFSSPSKPSPTQGRERETNASKDKDDDEEVPVSTAQHHIEISSQSSSSSFDSSDGRDEQRRAGELMRAQSGKVSVMDTQDILNMGTQVPDLGIPLPLDSDDEDEDESSVDLTKQGPVQRFGQRMDSSTHASSSLRRHDESIFYDSDEKEDFQRLPTHRPNATAIPPPAPSPPQRRDSLPAPSQSARKLSQTQRLVDGDDVDTYMTTLNIRHGFRTDAIINALKCTSMRPELAEIVLFDERSGKGFPSDVAGVWSGAEDAEIEGGVDLRWTDAAAKHGGDEVMARLEFLKEWRE